jgi:YHS domain-containing protein
VFDSWAFIIVSGWRCTDIRAFVYSSVKSLTEGSRSFVVQYDGRFYSFASESALLKFMRQPWVYSTQHLPARVPHKTLSYQQLTRLPLTSYLDHTLSTMLNQALIRVGQIRPKLPFQDGTWSASELIALYLKGKRLLYSECPVHATCLIC